MVALLLANWRLIAIGLLIAIPAGYGAVQKVRFEHVSAEYAQYRAQVAAVAAEAEIRNAQTALEHEKNAREALDGLQTRFDALSTRYAGVRRAASSSSGAVSSPAGDASAPSACPAGQPDATTRCLAILEIGDRELAKYRELWELGRKNVR